MTLIDAFVTDSEVSFQRYFQQSSDEFCAKNIKYIRWNISI